MARKRSVKGRGAGIRSVSLPPELNARMAKCRGVNWSAVAMRAFELELGRRAEKQKEKNMDDVVQRLKASRFLEKDREYEVGFEVGESWAKHDAQAGELERLENFQARCGREWADFFEEAPDAGYSPAELLACEIVGEVDTCDRRAASDFWETVDAGSPDVPVGLSQSSWLRGFAEGSLSIWEQVKDRL